MSELNHPEPVLPSPRRLRIAAIVTAVVVVAVVVLGIVSRLVQARELKTWTAQAAIPTVNIVHPRAAAAALPLDLPGRIEAYYQAPIYARVGGYLKSWRVDIGAQVKAGELLAQIDTPDLDQQLLQARANLASAKANAALSAITAKRWQAMYAADPDSVAKQDVDQRRSDYAAKQALVNAAQASVEQLATMKNYARIVAPFDGVVTARNIDVGALVNPGSASGKALFVVADTRRLRVYVQVPQRYASALGPGSHATLSVPGYPGRSFDASFDASAHAVDASSGSTLIQLAVANPDGVLLPGSYASVRFDLDHRASAHALSIPASALLFDAQGLRVATVDADGKVRFKPVTLLRDDGKTVQIGSGLNAQDRVIDSPPDGLDNGDPVRIATPQAQASVHAQA